MVVAVKDSLHLSTSQILTSLLAPRKRPFRAKLRCPTRRPPPARWSSGDRGTPQRPHRGVVGPGPRCHRNGAAPPPRAQLSQIGRDLGLQRPQGLCRAQRPWRRFRGFRAERDRSFRPPKARKAVLGCTEARHLGCKRMLLSRDPRKKLTAQPSPTIDAAKQSHNLVYNHSKTLELKHDTCSPFMSAESANLV